MSSRQSPNRALASLVELELIVRPPGDPAAVRAFTAAEQADAEQYARETGTTVERLGK